MKLLEATITDARSAQAAVAQIKAQHPDTFYIVVDAGTLAKLVKEAEDRMKGWGCPHYCAIQVNHLVVYGVYIIEPQQEERFLLEYESDEQNRKARERERQRRMKVL